MEEALELYFSVRKPGEDIAYTQIVGEIMSVDGVRKVSGLTIKKDDVLVSDYDTEYDIVIDSDEVPKIGDVTLTYGGN